MKMRLDSEQYSFFYSFTMFSHFTAVMLKGNLRSIVPNRNFGLNTHIFRHDQHLAELRIKRVMFLGDFCSPLLLVIAFVPLSVLLSTINVHHELRKNGSHLNYLFMEFYKLCARTLSEMDI